MSSYLIEFRFHGYAKKFAKDLIYDVSRKFKVKGATDNRAVPHVSLYGGFSDCDEKRLKYEIESIGKKYDLVEFSINNFGYFNNQNKVIYFHIEPSNELILLRKEISSKLSKFTNSKPWDKEEKFSFHATIAFKDIDYKFNKIWNYIKHKPKPNIRQHLLRITIIKNGKILYEYDLMQKKLLYRQQALNKFQYYNTIKILKQKTSEYSQDIEEKESFWNKIKKICRI